MIAIGRRAPEPADLVAHLLECHGRIRKFVELAAKVAGAAASDLEIAEACAAVERYFERALPHHIEDEELSVVPRLRGLRADIDEALRTMEAQHEVHRPLVDELLAASGSVRQAPRHTAHRERLRVAAARLAVEFEPHLELEERVVFPAIRDFLGADVQAQIRSEQRARREPGRSRAP